MQSNHLLFGTLVLATLYYFAKRSKRHGGENVIPRVRKFRSRQDRLSTIAKELIDLMKDPKHHHHQSLWIGICGVPGAGKTTFAGELAEEIGKHIPTQSLPMDGYHFERKVLDTFADPKEAHRRRGAPFTFDGKRFAKELREGRDLIDTQHQSAYFPSFDHAAKDPVERSITIDPSTKIVIVEGNYLLLDEEEWRDARKVLDKVFYLDVDLAVAKQRLASRHAAAWNWSLERAMERVEDSDYLNMLLIVDTAKRADEILQELSV